MHDLNDIDIAKMPAGREMDKLIDKYVLGHTVLQYQASESYINSRPWMISFYSTIIGAAWEVLTHFSRQGVTIHLSIEEGMDVGKLSLSPGDFNCPHNKPYDPSDGDGLTLIEYIPDSSCTVPLAICRAALMYAKEVRYGQC